MMYATVLSVNKALYNTVKTVSVRNGAIVKFKNLYAAEHSRKSPELNISALVL